MKSVITALICIVFFSCQQEKNKSHVTNDLKGRSLKGKVKSLTENSYNVIIDSGGARKDSLVRSNVFVFNLRGDEIEQWRSNKDGILGKRPKTIFKYKYDDMGFPLEKDQYLTSDSVPFKIKYTYDAVHNLIENNMYHSDTMNSAYKQVYKYDLNGNKIEEFDGNIRSFYKYDEKGNQIESFDSCYDSKLGQNTKGISKYNDAGFEIETIVSFLKDNTTDKYEYKYSGYDKEGNWTSRTDFKNGKAISIEEQKIEYY